MPKAGWAMRDAAQEHPFDGVVGRRLIAAEPILNEMQETVGTALAFDGTTVRLVVNKGEIETSDRS
jgi:hypothetical protein